MMPAKSSSVSSSVAEHAHLDQEEHDPADILPRLNTLASPHGARHRPESLERDRLRPPGVPGRRCGAVPAVARREVERLVHKLVRARFYFGSRFRSRSTRFCCRATRALRTARREPLAATPRWPRRGGDTARLGSSFTRWSERDLPVHPHAGVARKCRSSRAGKSWSKCRPRLSWRAVAQRMTSSATSVMLRSSIMSGSTGSGGRTAPRRPGSAGCGPAPKAEAFVGAHDAHIHIRSRTASQLKSTITFSARASPVGVCHSAGRGTRGRLP